MFCTVNETLKFNQMFVGHIDPDNITYIMKIYYCRGDMTNTLAKLYLLITCVQLTSY